MMFNSVADRWTDGQTDRETADLEMPYSLAPGMLGNLGRPPVAMTKYFDVSSFSTPLLSVHYMHQTHGAVCITLS